MQCTWPTVVEATLRCSTVPTCRMVWRTPLRQSRHRRHPQHHYRRCHLRLVRHRLRALQQRRKCRIQCTATSYRLTCSTCNHSNSNSNNNSNRLECTHITCQCIRTISPWVLGFLPLRLRIPTAPSTLCACSACQRVSRARLRTRSVSHNSKHLQHIIINIRCRTVMQHHHRSMRRTHI
jgi:hypothetical protein